MCQLGVANQHQRTRWRTILCDLRSSLDLTNSAIVGVMARREVSSVSSKINNTSHNASLPWKVTVTFGDRRSGRNGDLEA